MTLPRKSKKRAKRDRQADKWRKSQCQNLSRCEYCGKRRDFTLLCVHEIARGNGLRPLAMDKYYATLVVCALRCNDLAGEEEPVRQLARLYHSRPDPDSGFNLPAYIALIHPNAPEAITQEDVDVEIEALTTPATRR